MDGSKCKTKRLVAWLFLAVWLYVVITPVTAFDKILSKARIDGVDSHDLDVFMEKKIRYLHVRIDLKPSIVGLLKLAKITQQLAKGPADSLESTLSKSLEKRVTRIAERLARITGKEFLSERDKRSIEFIGDLISDIFGNPGPADWKKVNSNILALEGAIKRLDSNAEINHNDIDTNRHIIEQHNKEIKTLSLIVDRNQIDLEHVNVEMRSIKMFFDISILADTLDSLTLALIEIKRDGMRGLCNDRAVDKEFLVENIQAMEANKIGIVPIFGNWEWRQYFRFEMCTVALAKNVLWVTIRIPLVKKSEQLIRVIPSSSLKQLIDRTEIYGVKALLFRERDNDKFHVMTQSTFDLCNVLGNIRTCGARDSRFNTQSSVMAVEFMMNRFLILSNKLATITVTEKCPNKVREIELKLDTVMIMPVNCSYSANGLSIDTRESDIEITKEIGIIDIDELEIKKIENFHENVSKVFIEAIANRSSSYAFEKNRKEIKDDLDTVSTKHESLYSAYNLEKWIFAGVVSLAIVLIVVLKVRSAYTSRRIRSTTFNEIAELRSNLRLSHNNTRQEEISMHELNESSYKAEAELPSGNKESSKPNFSSPLSRSQFL